MHIQKINSTQNLFKNTQKLNKNNYFSFPKSLMKNTLSKDEISFKGEKSKEELLTQAQGLLDESQKIYETSDEIQNNAIRVLEKAEDELNQTRTVLNLIESKSKELPENIKYTYNPKKETYIIEIKNKSNETEKRITFHDSDFSEELIIIETIDPKTKSMSRYVYRDERINSYWENVKFSPDGKSIKLDKIYVFDNKNLIDSEGEFEYQTNVEVRNDGTKKCKENFIFANGELITYYKNYRFSKQEGKTAEECYKYMQKGLIEYLKNLKTNHNEEAEESFAFLNGEPLGYLKIKDGTKNYIEF